jgi:hypothetical protein
VSDSVYRYLMVILLLTVVLELTQVAGILQQILEKGLFG